MAKPNILLIRLDGAQARPYLENIVKVKNLRKLMKNGICFTNCYSVSTISHPSQTSIDTGVFPHKHGIIWNIVADGFNFNINKNIKSLPYFLKKIGYLTGKAGQGNGNDKNYDIDLTISYFKFTENLKKIGYEEETIPEKTFKYCGRLPYSIEYTRDGIYAKNAIKIIEKFSKKKSPWFVYCTFDGPHPPCKIPYPFDEIHKSENIKFPYNWNSNLDEKPKYYKLWKKITNLEGNLSENDLKILIIHYLGFLEMIDEVFGWIIEKIENLDLLSNTLIIFTSDHGGMIGNFGIVYHGGPILCEDAVKVPLFIFYGGNFQKREINNFVSTVDIFPTILEICNIKPPEYLDGKSLLPLIENKANNWRENIIFQWNSDGKLFYTIRGIRNKKFKFIYSPFGECEIYDVKNDPFETKNLGNSNILEIKELKKELVEYLKKTNDPVYEIAKKDLLKGVI
jgi:arylsulfatase A-like enzyme